MTFIESDVSPADRAWPIKGKLAHLTVASGGRREVGGGIEALDVKNRFTVAIICLYWRSRLW